MDGIRAHDVGTVTARPTDRGRGGLPNTPNKAGLNTCECSSAKPPIGPDAFLVRETHAVTDDSRCGLRGDPVVPGTVNAPTRAIVWWF